MSASRTTGDSESEPRRELSEGVCHVESGTCPSLCVGPTVWFGSDSEHVRGRRLWHSGWSTLLIHSPLHGNRLGACILQKKKKSPPPSVFQPATISLFFSTISLLESITFKATFTSYRPFIPSHSVRLTSTESVSVEVTGDLLVDCLVSLHVGRDRASFMNHRVPCCQPDACAQLALRKSWMNVL